MLLVATLAVVFNWVGGSDLINQNSSQSAPGGRFGSATWSDARGSQMLLFGGFGYAEGQRAEHLNDLWLLQAGAWRFTRLQEQSGRGSASTRPGGRLGS